MKEIRNKAPRDFLGLLYFAVVAAAVWGPALFANGYVLLGDMVFTPSMHPPASLLGPVQGTMNVTLLYSLAWVLSRAIGAVLLQKTVLFLIAFLPGYLMYRNVPCRNKWARLFAGTLYAVNPFVYMRMLMGQWGLLLGYALLPVALASVIKTVKEPEAGRCARTALWLAIIAVLSIHMGAIAVLVCLVAAIFELASLGHVRRAAFALIAILLLALLLSAFWFLPALKGGDLTGAIGKADLEVFQTRSTSRAGTAVSVLGLYGYWKNAIDPLLPRNYVPLWPAFAIGLVLLSLIGFWGNRRGPERGPLAKAFLVIGILGFFLSLGTRAPITGPLFSFVYDHLAAFRIFREPQKFAAMLVLAYSILGGFGLERFIMGPSGTRNETRPARRWRARLIPALLIFAVCFYSFRMFGSLWGEAKAASYPRSWAEAQEMLKDDAGDWRVLYLPPYWYMKFDFTGSDLTVTSPMPFYFTNRYIQLNALLVAGIQIDRQPVDGYVQAALETAREHRNLGALLAPLDVKYVLMPLNIASSHFRFVEKQGDLEVVRRWGDLVLLRNKVPVNHLTLVESRGSYTTWEALGDKAAGGNLLGSFLPKGTKTVVPQVMGTPLPHTDTGAGTVKVTLPPSRAGPATVLFSEPYSPDWKMSGDHAFSDLEVISAFPLEADNTREVTIRYRNDPLVIGCVASGSSLILCIILLAVDSHRKKRE